MKLRKPNYYDRFRCIAGACSDSCCIGWEIDINQEKLEFYRKVPGELGERLRRCIDWEEGHFRLEGKEERCPFLNKDHLCDLLLGLSEDSLCDICREHPRFYDWFEDATEVGLGLCCEEAARLLLEDKEPFCLVEEELDEAKESAGEESDHEESEHQESGVEVSASEEAVQERLLVAALFSARETAFLLIQNRKHSIWERLLCLLSYAGDLQDCLDFGDAEGILALAEHFAGEEVWMAQTEMTTEQWMELYFQVLELCRRLEPIDEGWVTQLSRLEDLAAQPERLLSAKEKLREVTREREYEYEKLASYFVYRYFMKCRDDGAVRSKAGLVLVSVVLIHLMDIELFSRTGQLTKEDRVENAKACSKELEYSEENLELVEEAF